MFKGLRILYLDDEPLVAFDTGDHLASLDFDEVVVTYRLDQAEAASNAKDFDLAILDINVDRGQTSLALGEKLANDGCAVLFASGYGEAAAKLRAQGYGFIDKPFSLDALTEVLSEMAQKLEPSQNIHTTAAG